MGKAKFDYLMDKASDNDVFKAVMFACKMIREGTYAGQAIRTASQYYDCDMDEVAKLVGQRGGRRNAEKISHNASKKKKARERENGKAEARRLELEMIKSYDGKPFYISREEERLSKESGFPVTWFKDARNDMREEGLLSWETIKDENDHIIGTWFSIFL